MLSGIQKTSICRRSIITNAGLTSGNIHSFCTRILFNPSIKRVSTRLPPLLIQTQKASYVPSKQQQQQDGNNKFITTQQSSSSLFSSYLSHMFPRHVISEPVYALFDLSSSNNKSVNSDSKQHDSMSVGMIDISQSRSLIRLEGPDTLSFLQGLLTNHIIDKFGPAKLPAHSVQSMNAAILNSRGRMLFDVLLTSSTKEDEIQEAKNATQVFPKSQPQQQQQLQVNRTPEYQQIYLECDSKVVDDVITHLKRCKIRSKVSISKCDPSQTSIFAVLGSGIEQHVLASTALTTTQSAQLLVQDLKKTLKLNLDHKVIAVPDPRLPQVLGYRFYMLFKSEEEKNQWHKSAQMQQQQQQQQSTISYFSNPDIYHRIRMLCGVSEGASEMPADESLPLDNNFDILHGIDWHKGCYVGQELTARSHFTGQVRKRVFPVYPRGGEGSLEGQGEKLEYCADPDKDNTMATKAATSGRRERNAGKLVAHTSDGKLGLGLVRFENILPQDTHVVTRLSLNGQVLTLVKPFWMHARDLYQQEEEDDVDEEEDDDYELEFDDEYETTATTEKESISSTNSQ